MKIKINKKEQEMVEMIKRKQDEVDLAFDMFLSGLKEAEALEEEKYKFIEDTWELIRGLCFSEYCIVWYRGHVKKEIKPNSLLGAGYLICKSTLELRQRLDRTLLPEKLYVALHNYIMFVEEIFIE